MENEEKISLQPVDAFIRAQGLTAAIINMVVNPALAWLGNQKMAFVPIMGDSCIVVDTIITSLILSVLVALFSSAGIRGYLKAGGIKPSEIPSRAGKLISRLPDKAWAEGLVIGFIAIIILLPITIGLF